MKHKNSVIIFVLIIFLSLNANAFDVFIGKSAHNEPGLKKLIDRLPQLVDAIQLKWQACYFGRFRYANSFLVHSQPQCWSSTTALYQLLRKEKLMSFEDFLFYPFWVVLGDLGDHVVLAVAHKYKQKIWFLDATMQQFNAQEIPKIVLADSEELKEYCSKIGLSSAAVENIYKHGKKMPLYLCLSPGEWMFDNCYEFFNYMEYGFNILDAGFTTLRECNASF